MQLENTLTSHGLASTCDSGKWHLDAHISQMLIPLLPRLRRYALRICCQADVADDLVQIACEKALTTDSGPALGAPFDAWMFRILRNTWIDGVRRMQTEGVCVCIDDHDQADEMQGDAQMEARLTLEKVRQAMDLLPVKLREVLMLVRVEELSYSDAARALGIPLGTVMSRLSRARARLAEITGWQLADTGNPA